LAKNSDRNNVPKFSLMAFDAITWLQRCFLRRWRIKAASWSRWVILPSFLAARSGVLWCCFGRNLRMNRYGKDNCWNMYLSAIKYVQELYS
jgi:hypothetical protein